MSSGGVGPPNSAPCGDNTTVVVAQSPNDAPLPDGTSQGGVAKDSCPQMPSALPKSQGADWPTDLLYRLLVQSGVNCDEFAKTSTINGAQDTGVSNDYFDNNVAKAHPAATPNNISSSGATSTSTTRPDELIVSVLQHILPGLKRPSTNECTATDIPWDDTRGGYRASTLADIKETAATKFALSMSKESRKGGACK